MQLPPDQAVKSTVTAVWSGDGGDVGGGVGVCVCARVHAYVLAHEHTVREKPSVFLCIELNPVKIPNRLPRSRANRLGWHFLSLNSVPSCGKGRRYLIHLCHASQSKKYSSD